jgi:hypothetical protein
MYFSILDDKYVEKLTVLSHSSKVYYQPEDNELYIAKRSEMGRELVKKDKDRLMSMYNRMYYLHHVEACDECREPKMYELYAEMNMFMDEMKDKYGS